MSWEKNVRKVEPYVAGEQPKDPEIIKLNTNECPYPPSSAVRVAAIQLADHYDRLRLYPDMDATTLVNALSEYYHVDPAKIFVGVGSDDVLAMSFLTFFFGGGNVLFPDITYSFYDVWAELYRIPYVQVPLDEKFELRPQDYISGAGGALDEVVKKTGTEPGGIIFPNPNAPTGVAQPLEQIEEIIKSNPDCVVIVDEAYVDFGAPSALPLIDIYENLLVVQTFSKSRAMAGLRIGCAFGSEKLIGYLKDAKFSFNSYTMNLPAIMLGTAAAKDASYFRDIVSKVVSTREWFKKELTRLGFEFPDSQANFVFARHPQMPGAELFAKLRDKKICVRYFNKPRINDYLRITIGTDAQMRAVVKALEEILG